MNRYQQRPQPKQPMTVAQSLNNLRMLLVGCSDHALAAMTPEFLASSYRVKPAEASKMLTEQRRHREARA
jgi:hypothetical protein